jgi:tRNA_anti-like
MADRDEPIRFPPEEDEDYPRPLASRYRQNGGPRGKNVSVLGTIALVIGTLSLVLSFIPCFGLIMLPLPILGLILALVSVLVSAIGQRDGLRVPVSGTAVNALAIVIPIAMTIGFCGLSMQGARQAQQQAMMDAQAEEERERAAEAERSERVAAKTAGLVGIVAGPQASPLLALESLTDVFDHADDEMRTIAVNVDVDQLVRDYDLNPRTADRKYRNQKVRIRGTVDQLRQGPEDTVVILVGNAPGLHKVECQFDDPLLPEQDAARVQKNLRITIEGICDGRDAVRQPVRISSCKLAK